MLIIFNSKEEMEEHYVEYKGEPMLELEDTDVILIKQGHNTEIVYGPFTDMTEAI